MNMTDIVRFDRLHYQKDRTEVEEAEYRVLLERVILGEDGKSEFDTAHDSTGEFGRLARKMACEEKVKQLVAEVMKFGVEVGKGVLLGLAAALVKK